MEFILGIKALGDKAVWPGAVWVAFKVPGSVIFLILHATVPLLKSTEGIFFLSSLGY